MATIREVTESPIEELFMSALLGTAGKQLILSSERTLEGMQQQAIRDFDQTHIFVAPQVNVGNYRADFLLTTYLGCYPKMVAVECDGFAFHKQHGWQKIRDQNRDQFFRSKLIKTMRLSGSQITRDPYRSASDVVAELNSHRSIPDEGFKQLGHFVLTALPFVDELEPGPVKPRKDLAAGERAE